MPASGKRSHLPSGTFAACSKPLELLPEQVLPARNDRRVHIDQPFFTCSGRNSTRGEASHLEVSFSDDSEHLKRANVENAITLAKSFTRQYYRSLKSNDSGAASLARGYAQHFCDQAMEMLRLIDNEAVRGDLLLQVNRIFRKLSRHK